MKLTYTLVALAPSIAKGLLESCPEGDNAGDEAARNECAAKLTNFAGLRNAMREPFIWGGQVGNTYELNKKTNKFNARVWRRMYLSTFMFGSDYTSSRSA